MLENKKIKWGETKGEGINMEEERELREYIKEERESEERVFKENGWKRLIIVEEESEGLKGKYGKVYDDSLGYVYYKREESDIKGVLREIKGDSKKLGEYLGYPKASRDKFSEEMTKGLKYEDRFKVSINGLTYISYGETIEPDIRELIGRGFIKEEIKIVISKLCNCTQSGGIDVIEYEITYEPKIGVEVKVKELLSIFKQEGVI